MDRIKLGSVFFMLVLSVQVVAQDKKEEGWEDGSLEAVEIEIVKERQITLPRANRNFEKIPPRPAESIKPPMSYDFRAFNFNTPEISPVIRPLKLKQEGSSHVYGGYLTAGYGNYASPYLEGFYNTGRDRNKLVGAHGWLDASGKGPVDGKNSGSGSSGISIFGRTFSEAVSVGGDIGFENRTTHFYGYPDGMEVSRDTIKQSYNQFSLGAVIENARNSDFSYKLGGRFSHLGDKFDAQETEVDLDFGSSYKISEEKSVEIKAGYYLISRKDSEVEAKPRNLFIVNPAYAFQPIDGVKISAGIMFAYETDTLDSKDIHVYPDIRGSYALSPSVDVVASLTGGIDKVSLQSLSQENIWLAPNVPIYHTNKHFDLAVGLRARLGNKVAVQGGLSMASLKNLYFFINDSTDQSKFVTTYDDKATKRSNLYASLSYAQAEDFKFMLRGDYYNYLTDDLAEAWHRPTYRLSANAFYNLYDKLLFTAGMIAQGGMKAFDHTTDGTVKLDAAFDLNFKTEYIFSESFSFFVDFTNIASTKYPLFLNYPARGLQVMGGVTWSF